MKVEDIRGLTEKDVRERIGQGLHNKQPETLTRSVSQIVISNIFTLFNLLNIILAFIILLMGDWKNALFIGVAVANTAIGIFQEIRSKRKIDELAILAQKKTVVVRDSKTISISPDDLVLDDVFIVSEGDQIPSDGTVLYTDNLEIDQSLLTGEPNHIEKTPGQKVMSGSFVTAGTAYIRVDAVGNDNYATKLSVEAKEEKKKHSKLMRTLNNIIRVLTVVIVPVGALLFYSRYSKGIDIGTSVLGATAAMIGMIPEGLMLLTSVTFAVGAMNLAKHKTLVQTLPSIETLARVDVLCLDKTGTITDGKLTLEEIMPIVDFSVSKCETILSEIMCSIGDKNPTANAIVGLYCHSNQWTANSIVPFSSKRKWSGASFDNLGSYVIGAPEFLFSDFSHQVKETINKYTNQGLRVLVLGYSPDMLVSNDIPDRLQAISLLILSDNIRPNAIKTFKFFSDEGVEIKVISGDNAITVSHIARQAKIQNAEKYIDMSTISEKADLSGIIDNYVVFGRVSPYQKRELVRELQRKGKTVCMTGDGVNDVLALKEADCAVAMVEGSDAARSVSDFVLLGSDFGAMVEVLKEGRRVINNIENVASLYLIKTIYSTILSVLFIYLPFAYPFSPLQMGPINGLTVGIPSFLLALEANYSRPKGKFISNILENALPAAVTVVFNIIILQIAGSMFSLSHKETSTMSVLLTGAVGFALLFKITKPFDIKKGVLYALLVTAFLGCFIVLGDFFEFDSLFTRNIFFYVPLAVSSWSMFNSLSRAVSYLQNRFVSWWNGRRKRKLV